VKVKHSVLKPPSVSAVDGAAIASSKLAAYTVARMLRAGDRVLVLGGAGGVGSTLIQLASKAGPSFLAATTTQVELVKSLGAELSIDYRLENWWEKPEFKANRLILSSIAWAVRRVGRRARRAGR